MAQYSKDDAFREIQLNGKQLVFLFMVATVFSVVIFLCGVFVGRGVRAERAPLVADSTGGSPAVIVPDVVTSQEPPPPPAAGSDPTAAAPPAAVDELSYFNRLDKSSAPAEDLKPAASARGNTRAAESTAAAAKKEPPPVPKEPAPPVSKEPPVSAPKKEPAPPAPPVDLSAGAASKNPPPAGGSVVEPAGQGFALQVTALREKDEADTIAKRLSSKGYTAYVMAPAKGAPSMYRVRVGKFKTRREAEAMATKLKKEEQFSPWITR